MSTFQHNSILKRLLIRRETIRSTPINQRRDQEVYQAYIMFTAPPTPEQPAMENNPMASLLSGLFGINPSNMGGGLSGGLPAASSAPGTSVQYFTLPGGGGSVMVSSSIGGMGGMGGMSPFDGLGLGGSLGGPLGGGLGASQPLNLFDALNQMMHQLQGHQQEDVQLVLKDDELKKLPKLTFEQLKEEVLKRDPQRAQLTDDESCPICLVPYSENGDQPKCTILPCNHYFCHECIATELSEYRHICPLCKNNVGEYEIKQ